MKTLIADDDDITRLLLSSVLRKLGHDVHEARNGREALDAWQSGGYSLIISDWMTPNLNGLEFCRRVRAENHRDYTYIILLTSRLGRASYLEGKEAGVDDFVEKPFGKDVMTARVRVAEHTLEQRRAVGTAAGVLPRLTNPPEMTDPSLTKVLPNFEQELQNP